LLYWLRTEFGVEKPGQKLEAFDALDSLDGEGFVEEARKRRPRSEGRLTRAALRSLRSGYAEVATPVREDRAAASALERCSRISSTKLTA
jgi:hypothetical protein